MLGGNSSGTSLICSGFMRRVRGSLRVSVKQGPLGSASCWGVRVLSREVRGGKRSTDLPVALATQYAILMRRSSKMRLWSSVKSYRSQQSGWIWRMRMSKKSMLYCASEGYLEDIFDTITLAVDPFSIVSKSTNQFRFICCPNYDNSLSVRRCCISRPPGRWVQVLQCSWHLGHSYAKIWLISYSLSTFGGSLFDSLRCLATSLAAGLQLLQKHCSMECQSTTGPQVASRSMRSLMQECSRLGGRRNWCRDFRVILYGSWRNLGGSWGTLKWKILRYLLASARLSLPWNQLRIRDLPYLPLSDSGFCLRASSGLEVPMICFHLRMGSPGESGALTRTITQHSPLSMQARRSSKQGLASWRQNRLATSSLSSSRWKMFLMARDPLFSMSCRTSWSLVGSSTVSGLIRATVKGRFTCKGSNSPSSMQLYFY